MATNYDIIIRSDKVNQEIATDILNYISENRLVHFFKYLGYNNEINCYVRGYIDLREILIKHGFDETDFTEIMDEFNRAYRYMISLDAYGNPLPDDHPEKIKDKEIADEIEAKVAAGEFTIWNVGKEADVLKQYQREKETDKSLPKTIQSVDSFRF